MTAEQLALDLWPDAERTDPATCPHVRATVDVGGGKAKCGAWGDGETWTNCPELGYCTLFETRQTRPEGKRATSSVAHE